MTQKQSAVATFILELSLGLLLVFVWTNAACSDDLVLENRYIRAVISSEGQSVTLLVNKLTGEAYSINGRGFSIELGKETKIGAFGIATPQRSKLDQLEQEDGRITFHLSYKEFTFILSYRLRPDDHFVEKTLRVQYHGEGSYNVNRLIMFDWALEPNAPHAFRYWGSGRGGNWPGDLCSDPQRSANAIGYFLRDKRGGAFLALSTDYFAMEHLKSRYVISYWPGYILPADQALDSEKGLIGVYQRRGYMFRSVYTPRQVASFAAPQSVTTLLDRAEIDSYCACVKKYLPRPQYRNWVNGWALGLPTDWENPEQVARAKSAVDRIVPLAGPVGAISGFLPWCGLYRQLPVTGAKTPWVITPGVKNVAQYMDAKGFAFVGVSHPGNNIPDRRAPHIKDKPEWARMGANGERETEYAIGHQYADFLLDRQSRLIEQGKLGMWIYDFLHFGQDYDTEHGYLPGAASLYPQWRNMLDVNRGLRQRFPDLALAACIGWIGRGPWFHEHISVANNCQDLNINANMNFCTYSADAMVADNVRLSNWYNHCSRTMPMYSSNATIGHYAFDIQAWDRIGYQYSVLSNIATSRTPGQIGIVPDAANGEPFLPEEIAFLRRWLTWAREHEEYYQYETLLFGEPRRDGVDGYAYCKPTDGILFICNPSNVTHTVSVPIGQDIGLAEGQPFLVRELYPQERYRIGLKSGLFPHGSHFVVEVPSRTIMVFDIQPYRGEKPLLLGVPGEVAVVEGKLSVRGVSGPPGTANVVALKSDGIETKSIMVNGKEVPCQYSDGLLLAMLKFAGEPIQRELTEWEIRRVNGAMVRLSSEFFVPQRARDTLASQEWSFNPKLNTPALRAKTAWINPSRFIISLPFRIRLDNLAHAARATADGHKAGPGIGRPENVNDGERERVWRSLDTTPGHWVQLTWLKPTTMNRIRLRNCGLWGGFKVIRVLYDKDGQWMELFRTPDCKFNQWVEREFPEIITTKLRMVIDSTLDPNKSACLSEWQVFGPGIMSARLNGRKVGMNRNMMRNRVSGLFIDASAEIEYGQTNRLELSIPDLRESDWITSPRLENLTVQSTEQFTPLTPPDTLPLVARPFALDAFAPIPGIKKSDDGLDFVMELEFSSESYQGWQGSISLEGGNLTELLPVGFSTNWGDALDAQHRSWRMTTDGGKKSLRMHVQGRLNSKLRLALPNDKVEKSLGEILDPVLSGKDVWQSRTLQVKVGKSGVLGFVVRGQPVKKMTVAAGKQ